MSLPRPTLRIHTGPHCPGPSATAPIGRVARPAQLWCSSMESSSCTSRRVARPCCLTATTRHACTRQPTLWLSPRARASSASSRSRRPMGERSRILLWPVPLSRLVSSRPLAVSGCVPEGDTVFLAAERLDAALAGETLVTTDLRVPRYATLDLSGRSVSSVVARGKHLLFRIDDGQTLHTHFKMEGSWHLYRPGQTWRGPDHEVRAVLATQDRVAVGFRLAVLEV